MGALIIHITMAKVGDIEEITRLRGASSLNTGVEQLGSGFQIKL